MAPDVRDATSVAASLFAWDGYPAPALELSAVVPTLTPVLTNAQPLLVKETLDAQPVVQNLPPTIDSITPVIIPVQPQELLLNLDSVNYTPASIEDDTTCDIIHLVTSDPPLFPDLYAPLYPVFNIYRDSYPCFDDQEYASLPKPGSSQSPRG